MRWGLLAVLVLVLMMPLWGLQPYGKQFDYKAAGTWGDWVSGLGQFAAVATAIGVVFRSEHRDRERQQTSVAAWMNVLSDVNEPYWAVQIENSASLPVFRWRIDSPDGAVHLCHEELGPITPGRTDYEVAVPAQADQSHALPLKMTFVDSGGQLWSRSEMGGISKVRGPITWHQTGTSS
ncbi:hypothetical protein AB5J52_33100 [Streptomyces sp. R39]|uniref:Uncharacterized protein n=1 Tax=Streptomyces sp. R39 TaxID=3238631 RepID=A0AB39QSZ9_9ACTN|nr:hypothetical protein [Streptomyces shenzhenensis]